MGDPRLVVEPGDAIQAEGRLVRMDGAAWLDLAQLGDLIQRTGPWRSDRSVRLVGADAQLGGRPWATRAAPARDRLRVSGVWHDEVIEVEQLSEVTRSSARSAGPLFDLPAPAGGWARDDRSTEIEGVDELVASGQIVRHDWLYWGGLDGVGGGLDGRGR